MRARGNRRPVGAGFWLEERSCSGGRQPPRVRLTGAEEVQAQQDEPVRMALASDQFPVAFALALIMAAGHETPMVQEKTLAG